MIKILFTDLRHSFECVLFILPGKCTVSGVHRTDMLKNISDKSMVSKNFVLEFLIFENKSSTLGKFPGILWRKLINVFIVY